MSHRPSVKRAAVPGRSGEPPAHELEVRQWKLIAAIAAALLAVPTLIWFRCLLRSEPVSGIRLQGEALPEPVDLTPYLRARADLWASQAMQIKTGVHVWSASRVELGASLPVETTKESIESVGHSANPFVTLPAWWRSTFGNGHDLAWRPVIDESLLDRMVEAIRQNVDRPPTVGSFDPNGKQIPGLAGEAVDIETTKSALRSALGRHALSVEVPTLITPPPRTFRRFVAAKSHNTSPTRAAAGVVDASVDTSVLMMRQETEFRARTSGRATNIEIAAQKLDGIVIMPGAELSFNEVVGKREARRGFAPALELMNGELAMGIGGGVCQVAGTLHAAAFFAGLMVLEYRPHSRLSQLAYLRPGLDTMVAWPDHVDDVHATKDMRVRNPYPFPITVRTSILNKDAPIATLRVELYGAARAFRVDWGFEEVDKVPSQEVVRYDRSVPRGQQRVQQEGLPGQVIMRKRVIYTPERPVQEEVRVAYPPTPRIVIVGAG